MVTFYIANSIEEVENNENYLELPEDIHAFFQREFYFENDMKILTQLSFYGDVIFFDSDKINELLELSKQFKFHEGKNKKKVKSFFKDLESFCSKSLEKNKLLIAIGD